MTDKHYSSIQILLQNIASLSWLLPITKKLFPFVDRMVFNMTDGRHTFTSFLGGMPLVMVHTIGAKSGLTRSTPLMCIRKQTTDAQFALIASNVGQKHLPAWYYNLKANPQVECTIRGETRTYLATDATDEDYQKYWSIAEKIYLGYPKYKERADRHIPIFIMTPIDN